MADENDRAGLQGKRAVGRRDVIGK